MLDLSKKPVSLKDFSIIIPIAENEEKIFALIQNLEAYIKDAEIFIVIPHRFKVKYHTLITIFQRNQGQILCSRKGRARQMNAGARKAQRTYVWFLHADSVLSWKSFNQLKNCVDTRGLYYFKLQFLSDGPKRVKINEVFANLRSVIFGLPFGDQGFCLSRQLFWEVEGFDEQIVWGEDHLFVWKWRKYFSRRTIKQIPAVLATSARKYQDQGWFKTTCGHLKGTIYQIWIGWNF